MTGIDLITIERDEQYSKHKRSIESDVKDNESFQLSLAASILCLNESNYGCNDISDFVESFTPVGWSENYFSNLLNKQYKQRLIIAGALIAAEIDRINALSTLENNPNE